MDDKHIRSERWTEGDIDIPVQRGGDGQSVLFLNAGEATHRSDDWLTRLAEKWQVHAPGYPGGATSDFSDQVRSVSDLALLYLDYLDETDARDVVLIGASFGGWVAAEIAVRNCSRLAGLVLLDPVGIKIGGRTERDITDIYSQLPDDRKAALYFSDEQRNYKYSESSEDELKAVVRDRTAEAFYSWSPFMHNPTLKGWLHRITVPTLVLWGAADGVVSLDYGKEYAASIPGASFATIGNSAHYPHVENPGDTFDEVDKFVARLS